MKNAQGQAKLGSFNLLEKDINTGFLWNSCFEDFHRIRGKKLLRWSILVVMGLSSCNFTRRVSPSQLFPREFCKIFQNKVFSDHLQATTSINNPK